MIFEFNSYRSYLRAVLTDRITKNPRYSLRAMAQQLGFAPSSLSEVINGRANFSAGAARKAASGLKLAPIETEYLCLLVEFESARDPEARELVMGRMRAINSSSVPSHDLAVDQFRQISEWYHSAILELVNLDGFAMTAANLSRRLGITRGEAQAALERLERLQMIVKKDNGRYWRIRPRMIVRSSDSNQALQSFYRQMLTKADEAVARQPVQQRVSGYETFLLAPEAIPAARAAADRFLNELQDLSARHVRHTGVYHALVHIFDLAQERRSS